MDRLHSEYVIRALPGRATAIVIDLVESLANRNAAETADCDQGLEYAMRQLTRHAHE